MSSRFGLCLSCLVRVSVVAAWGTMGARAADPVVSNVRASQREGEKFVDVYYDLHDADGGPQAVSISATDDGLPIHLASCSGDLGADIVCGKNRHIVWDAGADWPSNWSDRVKFTVTAADSGDYFILDLTEGSTATTYPMSFLAAPPAGGWSEEYKTTKMVFRRIPAGTFTMGSPAGELGRNAGETQHAVTLSRDFCVGVFEVTRKQWQLVMGEWRGYFTNGLSRPVEKVSYENIRGYTAGAGWPSNANVDATSFMGRLRARTWRDFDLPTEAQWEYACRAGTTNALNSGKNLTSVDNCPNMSEVGRYKYNGGAGAPWSDTSIATAAVGSYLPNAWGLYDMHGNVYEWCLDYSEAYSGPATDPKGPSIPNGRRVCRSGHFNMPAFVCRSAQRLSVDSWAAEVYTGFRIVFPMVQQ